MTIGDIILCIVVNENEKDNKNELISSIINKDIYGDVFCAVSYNPNSYDNISPYISINQDTCKKLLCLLSKPEFDKDSLIIFDKKNFTPLEILINSLYIKHK